MTISPKKKKKKFIYSFTPVPDFWKNESLASGTEWDDPWYENSLGPTEERKIEILVTKIAASVNKRQLVLKPFFQDYELVRLPFDDDKNDF